MGLVLFAVIVYGVGANHFGPVGGLLTAALALFALGFLSAAFKDLAPVTYRTVAGFGRGLRAA